jgi:site-specific recombinase XerD
MLHHHFTAAYVLSRIRSNLLGKIFDEFTEYLEQRGHTRIAIQNFIRSAEHFGHWLRLEKIPSTAVNEEIMNRFLDTHLPVCRCQTPAPRTWKTVHAALRHLLHVLNKLNGVPSGPVSKSKHINTAIEAFRTHLSKTCGLSTSTIEGYTRCTRELLEVKYASKPIDFASLNAADFMTFVSDYATRNSVIGAQRVASALRSYIRFLQLKGLCNGGLIYAVPQFPHWKLSHIPKVLTDKELKRFLSVFDRSKPSGQRDYAIALCMADLGLRLGEVARLSLDDIDWRKATLKIPSGKARRAKLLPLPKRLGKAIAAYIRNGRQKNSERSLFLRHKGRDGIPISAGVIRYSIRKAFIQAGLAPRFTGTHVLRHTAATRMHSKGASLKEVADVLGHQSLDVTAIYTKVNLPMLSTVPLPWPEV